MKRLLLPGLILACLSCGVVHAQSISSIRGGSYYRHAEASDVTMEIKVWGAVANPGFYEVREGLNLSTVLSLAGGPQPPALSRSIVSSYTIRLYRLQAGDQYRLFTETVMENQLGVLNSDPVLQTGDMVFTEAKVRQRFSWRDGLSLLTAVAAITVAVDQVFSP